MIKFEEHDGLIFKMLEKPVQLKEKNTNVLVQFITHGVIGEYVMEHWLDCNQENVPIFVDSVDSDGDVTVFIENGNEHYGCPFPMFEIIGYPVVDGSNEWALYQMMHGKKVCNPTLAAEKATRLGYDDVERFNTFWYIVGDAVVEGNGNYGTLSVSSWIAAASSTGWQLYKEPKIEPPKEPDYVICKRCGGSKSIANPAVSNTSYTACPKCGGTGYEIKEKKPDNLYLNIKPSNPVDWCFDKKNLLVLVDNNFKGIVGENVTREQVGEIAKLLTEPSPQYKVGDWVDCKDLVGVHAQCKVLEIHKHNVILECKSGHRWSLPHNNIIRKLSPSEVIVRIGCLSGTIRYCLSFHNDGAKHDAIKIFNSNGKSIAAIHLEALDTSTRELVESLLKAQEEK